MSEQWVPILIILGESMQKEHVDRVGRLGADLAALKGHPISTHLLAFQS